MGQIQDDDDKDEAIPKWIIAFAILVATPVLVFYGYVYFNNDKYNDLGTWGDFVGGTLNPILTFLTVIGLLVTIHLQQRELRLTRKELAKSSNALEAQNLTTKQQRFENTLFSMIEMLNQIVNAMDVEPERGIRISSDIGQLTTKLGSDCFSYFYEKISKVYFFREWNEEPNSHYILRPPNENNISSYRDDYKIYYFHNSQRVVDAYGHFYKRYQSDLGHYFRVLYNIFRYIDQSEFADGIYAKILRAQLSNQELLIIFYNNATQRGSAFAVLAERFELYDNMDTERLLRPEHIELASKKSFGKNPMTLPEEREHPS
jgi:hypothetical protein